jgi:NADPH:quinone reductase-like Zn-dependent oxidoreductase
MDQMSETFDAYVLEGQGPAVLKKLTDQDLPDGDVTVDVSYSSLNYKDGLALTGKGKIARSSPMVCGIDLAEASKRPLEPEKWAAGVDTVGSTTLATVLKQTRYGGSVSEVADGGWGAGGRAATLEQMKRKYSVT